MKRFTSILTIICLLFTTVSVTISAATKNEFTANEITADTTTELVSEDAKIPYAECINLEVYNSVETYQSNEITYSFMISPISKYDYINIAYATTTGVTLSSYMSKSITYDENATDISIEFTLSQRILGEDVKLDFHTAGFEKIYVYLYAYLDGNMIQERRITIYVLSTAEGSYISLLGDVYAYEKYIKDLLAKEIITPEAYTTAYRTITSVTTSYDHLIYSDEYVEEQLTKNYIDTTPVKYYDSKEFTIKTTSTNKLDAQLIPKESSKNISTSTQSVVTTVATTGITVTPVKVVLQRQVTASNSGKQLRIFGEVRWSDISGNFYKASNVKIEIIDRELTSDDVLATVYTNLNGAYDVTISNDTGIFEGGYDLTYKVWAAGSNFTIKTTDSDSVYSNGYYYSVPDSDNIKASTSQSSYVCTAGSDVSRAFNIHQAMVVGYRYYSAMNDGNVHYVNVYYSNSTSISCTTAVDHIQIKAASYFIWDGIIHELGHTVSDRFGFIDNELSYGSHAVDGNLLEIYKKDRAICLAWGEGWADYYSVMAQEYYNKNVKNISSIVGVANLQMDSFINQNGSILDIYSYHIDTYAGLGEGNEFAISATLYDIVTQGILTEKNLFEWLKSYKPTYLSEFIQFLYTLVNPEQYPAIGQALCDHSISDITNISQNTNKLYSRTTPGTFYWTLANRVDGRSYSYGDTNFTPATSNSIKFVFWDENFNIVYQTGLYSESTAGTAITLTTSQWNTITSAIDGDFFYWCVATYQSSSPTTGPYYSEFHKEPFAESATQITNLGTEYEDTLTSGGECWFTFTPTKTGVYTISSMGTIDLKSEIYDFHNFKKEPFEDDDSGHEENFMQVLYLYANQTIFIKVTGYYDTTAGYFDVLCTYIMEATSVAFEHIGYTDTQKGNWYVFTANGTGNYTFYTTGDSDTWGELYICPIPDGTTYNRLAVDTDSGEGNNFSITYTLHARDFVFIRVLGQTFDGNGSYTFKIKQN